MALEHKKDALVEEITLIPDAYERLGYIVDRGKKADGLTEDLRIDSFKIEGCMSQLWIVPAYKEGYYRKNNNLARASFGRLIKYC